MDLKEVEPGLSLAFLVLVSGQVSHESLLPRFVHVIHLVRGQMPLPSVACVTTVVFITSKARIQRVRCRN